MILLDSSIIIELFRKKDKIIDIADLFIAATTISHEIPLATLNLKHFERIDMLQIINNPDN
ncbi:MAG: type II toxin-antitoxin system VapC family toxin [Bacteroidales bacterium]|nr:type II toxin-antitoxin system VapC family toxin [Bacteroidales bacterium]